MSAGPGFTPIRTAPGPWTPEDIRRMPTQGFQKTLGIILEAIEPNYIVASIEVGTKHLNSGGAVHGGVLMALADSVGAVGAVQNLGSGQRTATLESKTNFVAAARGPRILATCRPVHIGRLTSIWHTMIEDADGRLVASITQTQLHIDPT